MEENDDDFLPTFNVLHDNIVKYDDISSSNKTYTLPINNYHYVRDDYTLEPRVIFKNYMPELNEIEDLCETNPTLDKAWEQFKMVYRLTSIDNNNE